MAGKYSPIDPVCLGVNRPAPNTPESVVGSVVVGNNADLMRSVADLWIRPDDVVADVTYGRGVFWRNIPGMPTFRFDANFGDDCRDLPLGDESVDVVVFDPPYRPTHGSTGMEKTGVGKAYRVGMESLNTINDILDLYRDGLIEAERILRPGGRVLVKCQDISYANRLHMVSMDVSRLMERAGLPMSDHFVLANSGQISSTKWQKQERARRRHSVLWVGVKG